MIQKSTLDFLTSLKKNNNKEWFDKNKEKYLAAKQNVEEFTDELIKLISAFDKKIAGLTYKDCVFRIYRDVRFSKNKTPYKTNMGASISAGGKKTSAAGYYMHIDPEESFIAGGMWMPPSDQLKKIRQEIDYNGKKFHKILDEKNFKKQFGKLDESEGYKLARPPKGYDKDHPDIELLKFNSYIVWHPYGKKDVLSKNFSRELSKSAKTMKPLIDFLNEAIS
jgi:uncharacterized protein (TIGR02453 family)